MPVADLDAAFQHLHQGTFLTGGRLIDDVDDGLLGVLFEDFAQLVHHIRLGLVQKLEQHPPVHGKGPIIVRGLADAVPVMVLQIVHDFMLVLFFGQNVIHDAGTSFLPVTYS